MMKLLRYEPGGLVIYNKRLDHGRMHLVERVQDGDPTITPFEWRRLIDTILKDKGLSGLYVLSMNRRFLLR